MSLAYRLEESSDRERSSLCRLTHGSYGENPYRPRSIGPTRCVSCRHGIHAASPPSRCDPPGVGASGPEDMRAGPVGTPPRGAARPRPYDLESERMNDQAETAERQLCPMCWERPVARAGRIFYPGRDDSLPLPICAAVECVRRWKLCATASRDCDTLRGRASIPCKVCRADAELWANGNP
jgi:hypothetical protein